MFSESVTGLTSGDFTVTTDRLCPSADRDRAIPWCFAVGFTDDSPVTGRSVQDLAGRNSLASNTYSVVYDPNSPAVTLTGPSGTQYGAFDVTVTFSKPVTGLIAADFTTTKVLSTSLTGSGANYTLRVTPDLAASAPLTATILLPADKCIDVASNNNLASNTLSVPFSTEALTPTLSFGGSSPGNTSPLLIGVTFNREVTGLTASDFTVTNGTGTAVRRLAQVTRSALCPHQ